MNLWVVFQEEPAKEELLDAGITPSPSQELGSPSKSPDPENPGSQTPNSSTAPWTEPPCALQENEEQQEKRQEKGSGSGPGPPEDEEGAGGSGRALEVEDDADPQPARHSTPLGANPGNAEPGGTPEGSQELSEPSEKEEEEEENEEFEDEGSFQGAVDLVLSESSDAEMECEQNPGNSASPEEFGVPEEEPMASPASLGSPRPHRSLPEPPDGAGGDPGDHPGAMSPHRDQLPDPWDDPDPNGAEVGSPHGSSGELLFPPEASPECGAQPDSGMDTPGCPEQENRDQAPSGERWESPCGQGMSLALSPDSSSVCLTSPDGSLDPWAAPEDQPMDSTPSPARSCSLSHLGWGEADPDPNSLDDEESNRGGSEALGEEEQGSPGGEGVEELDDPMGAGDDPGDSPLDCPAAGDESGAEESGDEFPEAENSPGNDSMDTEPEIPLQQADREFLLEPEPSSCSREGISAIQELPREQQSFPDIPGDSNPGVPGRRESVLCRLWRPCREGGAAQLSVPAWSLDSSSPAPRSPGRDRPGSAPPSPGDPWGDPWDEAEPLPEGLPGVFPHSPRWSQSWDSPGNSGGSTGEDPCPPEGLGAGGIPSPAPSPSWDCAPQEPWDECEHDPEGSQPFPDAEGSQPFPDPDPEGSQPFPDPEGSQPFPDPDPEGSQPFPDPEGSQPFPDPEGSQPFPDPEGSQPFPDPEGSQPFPDPEGSQPFPDPEGSQPFPDPDPEGSQPFPDPDPEGSQPFPDPDPEGSQPFPDPEGSQPFPDPEGSQPFPDPEGSQPFPDPDPEGSQPFPDPDPEGSQPFPDPDPEGSQPFPDPEGSQPFPDPEGSQPFPDPEGSQPFPDPEGSQPFPDPEGSQPFPDPDPEGSQPFPDPDREAGEGEIPDSPVPWDEHRDLPGERPELYPEGVPEQLPGQDSREGSALEDPSENSFGGSEQGYSEGSSLSPLPSRNSCIVRSLDAAGARTNGDSSSRSSVHGEEPWEDWDWDWEIPRDPGSSVLGRQRQERLENSQLPRRHQRHARESHLARSLLGTWRSSEEITQNTLDMECLRFHYKLKEILRHSDPPFPASQKTSIPPSPRSRSPLQVTIPPGDAWPRRSRGRSRAGSRDPGAPFHLEKLRVRRAPPEPRGDVGAILDEYSQFQRVVLGRARAGKDPPGPGRAGPGRSGPEPFRGMLEELGGALRSHLRRVADAARPGMFFLLETGNEPLFHTVRALLQARGFVGTDPPSFLGARRGRRLLVLVRNEDISCHIHTVPSLLELKLCPAVVFAGLDDPQEVTGDTFQELFQAGGFLVSDEELLERATLGQLREVLKVLEELNRDGRWKWLLHHGESRRLRADLRDEAQKKQLLLRRCQGEELLELLPFHACDSPACGPRRVPCLLALQAQHIHARFAVYLTENPGSSREILESKGILVADIDTFLGTVQELAAPFRRSYW
uniref:Protein FAM208B n=1 Tax=Cyanoderma ruficeps TaxID=181631 RepID=A0A8C3QFD1_9PASS